MKETLQALELETFSAEREWTAEGIPILRAEISLPQPTDRKNRTARRIHRFYQLQGRSYLRYCENWLAPRAAADCRLALASSAPLPQYTARLTYRITCNEGGILSLHTDSHEFAGGKPLVLRHGDTWDLGSGYPLPITAFFSGRAPIRKQLLQTAATEIRRQEDTGIAHYRDDWPQALKRSFNRNHFYITPEGLWVFWQMYAIAPAAEGIPAFCLPFENGVCQFPSRPEKEPGVPKDA